MKMEKMAALGMVVPGTTLTAISMPLDSNINALTAAAPPM